MRTIMRVVPSVLAVLALASSGRAQISVTPDINPNDLVNNILGPGISIVGTPQLLDGAGNPYSVAGAAGVFTGGASAGIGIAGGVVLTTGYATLIGPVNNDDGAGRDNGLPGYAPLGAQVPGFPTFDALRLKFDFTTPGGDLFFNYVFGSEEYNEFANSPFNDVFAFFLDGNNIALIPGTTTPVSINNVNGGNPLGTNPQNATYFNNNDPSDGGTFAFQYDGFTDVFTAQALGLSAGTHTIELAIADSGDHVLDSGVFIQGGTFSGEITPPGVPDAGSTLALFGLGLAGLAGLRRKL